MQTALSTTLMIKHFPLTFLQTTLSVTLIYLKVDESYKITSLLYKLCSQHYETVHLQYIL